MCDFSGAGNKEQDINYYINNETNLDEVGRVAEYINFCINSCWVLEEMIPLGYANLTKEGLVSHVSSTESNKSSAFLDSSNDFFYEVEGQISVEVEV